MPVFLTIDELAEQMGVTAQSIHAMRYRGDGPKAVRIGKTLKFRPEDIEAWIQSRLETTR